MELSGTRIADRYAVKDLIAEGGMSYVYHAADMKSGEPVVVKVLKSSTVSTRLEDIVRFRGVTDALSRIDHPNIVRIIETGTFNISYGSQTWYVVMEQAGETTLQDALRSRRFTPAEACHIVLQTCRALEEVHRNGIIHADIKPGNLLLHQEGETITVKITDFGLSRLKCFEEDDRISETSGTYAYMPPEQAGVIRKGIDERSDLYSLGVVWYELLTNGLPFHGDSIIRLLYKLATEIPERPSKKNGAVPAQLDDIVLKLLEKEPGRRYHSAAGLAYDIQLHLDGSTGFVPGGKDRALRIEQSPPMSGRDAEVSALNALLDDAQAGRGRICFITGEPGIGKTRLAEEFRRHVISGKVPYLDGRAFDRESKTPHEPIRDALTDYLRQYRRYSERRKNAVSGIVRAECGGLGRIIIDFFPSAEDILGRCSEIVALEPEREMLRFYMILCRFLYSIAAAEGALAIVLDDLQWSDMGTLRLLEELARDIHDKPLLVIGMFRRGEVHADSPLQQLIRKYGKDGLVSEMRLGKLEDEAVRSLVWGAVDLEAGDARELASYLARRSGGNPLFCLEMMKQLAADRVLVRGEAGWSLDSLKLDSIDVPATMVATMTKRIATLISEEKEILSRAAVIGKYFDIGILMRIESSDTGNRGGDVEGRHRSVVSVVDRAVMRQILFRQGAGNKYSFIHDHVCRAFYDLVPLKKRRKLHHLIGKTIEEMSGDNADPFIFDLAYHFIEAGDEEMILKYAHIAAHNARAHYSHEDAVEYLRILRNLLSEKISAGSGDEYRDLWIEDSLLMSETWLTVGNSDEALLVLQELVPLLRSENEKINLYLLMSRAYYKKGDFARVEEYARRGLAFLGENLDTSKRGIRVSLVREIVSHVLVVFFPSFMTSREQKDIEKYRTITWYYNWLYWSYFFSDSIKLAWCILRMINIAMKKIGKSRELVTSMLNYGIMRTSLSPDSRKRADRILSRAYSIALEINDDWALAECHWAIGYHNFLHCNFTEALEHQKKCINSFIKLGDSQGLRRGRFSLFYNLYINSNYREAYDVYLECSRHFKTLFDELSILSWGFPAEYYTEIEDFGRAEELLMRHAGAQRNQGIWYLYTISCIFLGHLFIEKGNLEKASSWLDEARLLIDSHNFPPFFITNYYILYARLLIEGYLCDNEYMTGKEKISTRKKMKDAVGTSLKKTKKMYLNIGIAYRVAASYFAAIRKPDEAERYYRLSIDANQKVARRYEVARSFYDYGVFLRRTGDLTGAWDILLSAYMLFEEIGVSAFRKRITKHLGLSQQPSDNAETAISREKMQYLLEKSREFGACSDLGDLLDRVLALAMEISGGRNGHLFLYDEDEGKLVKAASRFGDSTAPLDYSSHIVDRVFDCGKSLLIADAEMDESLSAYRSVSGQALKSVICLPLSYGDVVIGVCYFDNPLASGIFSEGTERLLEMLFSHAVVVIENLVLRARLDSRTGIEKLAHTDEQYVENAARYLDEHYPEEFHREKISGLLGVNADYLGRVFKAGTGKTMREYLNEARVREAVKRLADRDARIIDIAMDAGFDSMRTFYRIFYRIMGFTPAEYREKISKR